MSQDYGDDMSTFALDGSIDIDFEHVIEGPRVVLEAVARRWTMSLGALPWAPDEGENLLRAVNADLTPADLYRLGARLEAEASQERGVLGASVRVELREEGRLRAEGRIDLAEGSYELTIDTGEAAAVIIRRQP
jgi:hypothetical protein